MEIKTTEKRNFIDILKSNIKVIITIIISLVVLISFYSWFKYKENLKKNDLSEKYIEAKILLSQKNNNDALLLLNKIIEEGDGTYSTLSLYLIIDQEMEKDEKKILSYFDKILSIGNLKKDDLDLLKLKKAIFISDNAKENELLDLLNPIINSKSAWKVQATIFIGDYYYSKKQFNKAEQYYSSLLSLEDTNVNKKEIQNKIKNFK